MLIFHCSHCGHRLGAPHAKVGHVVHCLKCGRSIVVREDRVKSIASSVAPASVASGEMAKRSSSGMPSMESISTRRSFWVHARTLAALLRSKAALKAYVVILLVLTAFLIGRGIEHRKSIEGVTLSAADGDDFSDSFRRFVPKFLHALYSEPGMVLSNVSYKADETYNSDNPIVGTLTYRSMNSAQASFGVYNEISLSFTYRDNKWQVLNSRNMLTNGVMEGDIGGLTQSAEAAATKAQEP